MVTIGTLNGGNITITTGLATTPTRIWWSDDESDFSDCPSNNGTFSSSCFPEGKSNYEAIKVEFGSDVTNIVEYAFFACENLTNAIIPNSVTSIGNNAFNGCMQMTNVTIGNGVTSIGDQAFNGCGLTSVTIPNSVTNIGYSVFSNCGNLTSMTIPDSVTSIGSSAFSSCSGLTSVTIPDSVTSIGDQAFEFTGLTSVTIIANGGNAANVKQMMIDAIDDTDISDNITWNMPN